MTGSDVPVATSRQVRRRPRAPYGRTRAPTPAFARPIQTLLSLCEAAEALDNDGLKEVASAVVDAVQRRPSTFDDVVRARTGRHPVLRSM